MPITERPRSMPSMMRAQQGLLGAYAAFVAAAGSLVTAALLLSGPQVVRLLSSYPDEASVTDVAVSQQGEAAVEERAPAKKEAAKKEPVTEASPRTGVEETDPTYYPIFDETARRSSYGR